MHAHLLQFSAKFLHVIMEDYGRHPAEESSFGVGGSVVNKDTFFLIQAETAAQKIIDFRLGLYEMNIR